MGGDRYVKSLRCAEHFRVMAFAQLTYRESLRDIDAHGKTDKHRSLSDANEARDWRIYADFAQVLIRQARKLYAVQSFGVELTETAYALDSTTIEACLSAQASKLYHMGFREPIRRSTAADHRYPIY
jgi:hypothetical protein